MFENMTLADYYTALRPKLQASWNLHAMLPKQLDFFILLSSGSAIIGNRGQLNYCVGNTYQDALARYRVSQGLKATVLDLGLILSVGFVAENAKVLEHMKAQGYAAMREEEYYAMMDSICDPEPSIPSLLKSQISLGFEIPENLRLRGMDDPTWMRDPIFKQLYQIRSSEVSTDLEETSVNHAALLAAAESHKEAEEIVVQAVVRKLSRALGIEQHDIDPAKPLHAYGVDSLVAVELRTWVIKELGAEIAVFDMMGDSSIRALASLIALRSALIQL
jgi:acyl carrier protein